MSTAKRFIDEDIIISGVYEGEYLADVADEDPSYLYWMLAELPLTFEESEEIEDELRRVEGRDE